MRHRSQQRNSCEGAVEGNILTNRSELTCDTVQESSQAHVPCTEELFWLDWVEKKVSMKLASELHMQALLDFRLVVAITERYTSTGTL